MNRKQGLPTITSILCLIILVLGRAQMHIVRTIYDFVAKNVHLHWDRMRTQVISEEIRTSLNMKCQTFE
jgi:hypothetical protein